MRGIQPNFRSIIAVNGWFGNAQVRYFTGLHYRVIIARCWNGILSVQWVIDCSLLFGCGRHTLEDWRHTAEGHT